ncbi:self-incompatibility protein S1-like [Carica papaya]|uniref:self-incompatibility protein S1-like n=1 Tax=Carica papaya TaxID=3649 RepID=UPI000B8C7591|nr:self-incompatibility protein S1-like [Carica papaya]
MKSIRHRTLAILFMLLFGLSKSTAKGKTRVRVVNKLGTNRIMNIHCQSRDDDLGYHAILDGSEIEWKFAVNFWGTTLYYCDVQWDYSKWHHFDAYSSELHYDRCKTECIWMVTKDGLFNFNEEFGNWVLVPFQDSP